MGWSHGDDEIILTEQAIEWFTLDSAGRSPSRFDFTKLAALNGHYLRQGDDDRLTSVVLPLLAERLGHDVDESGAARIRAGMTGLKDRAKTVVEIADSALFYVKARPLAPDDKANKLLEDGGRADLIAFRALLTPSIQWSKDNLEDAARQFAETRGLKLGKVAQPLRAALTGSTVSPPIFEVMEILGREETLGRLDDAGATA